MILIAKPLERRPGALRFIALSCSIEHEVNCIWRIIESSVAVE